MALTIPRFKSGVDAAIHASEHGLQNFSIEKTAGGDYVIFMLDGAKKTPYTINLAEEQPEDKNDQEITKNN